MADDDTFWQAPAAALGPLVPNIPMSEKYLRRPPFRFLHDIVMALHNDRNLFAGSELTPAEYDAAAIDGKEQKVEFLRKVIAHVEAGLGRKIDVNPKKIASGSECEKTAVFLCDLAALATSRGAASSGGEVPSSSAATAAAAPPPPPPPPPPPAAAAAAPQPPPPPPPPPSTAPSASAAAGPFGRAPPPPPPPPVSPKGGGLRLNTDQLGMGGVDPEEKNKILTDAAAFKANLEAKGLGLDESEGPASPQKIATDIRTMELELKSREVPPTEPTKLSVEQIEKQLAKQLEMVRQIDELAMQNHSLMERIVRAAAP